MTLALLFPGQGSQTPGMGADVLAGFRDLVREADEILGYSVAELCAGQDLRMRDTRYVQPALYVVSALTYLRRAERGPAPAYLAGHSLGELTALFAAGCFDFGTGVRLAQRRGQLMARASDGGMTAVLGVPYEELRELLRGQGTEGVEIANHNLPDQMVLSGPRAALAEVARAVTARGRGKSVPLNVSIAAHSRHMADAAREFAALLRQVPLSAPALPVIANVTARPYGRSDTVELLTRHLTSPVRWWETLCLLASEGVDAIEEIGPGTVLTTIWQKAGTRLPRPAVTVPSGAPANGEPTAGASAWDVTRLPTTVVPPRTAAPSARSFSVPYRAVPRPSHDTVPGPPAPPAEVRHLAPRARRAPDARTLGSESFRRAYGTGFAYAAGGMGHGVSGPALVSRLADAALIGFLGTEGRTIAEVAADLNELASTRGSYGISLPAVAAPTEHLRAVVELALRRGVRHAEASGAGGVTDELAIWRFTGARRGAGADHVPGRELLVKVAHAASAEAFLRPVPAPQAERLRAIGALTEEETWVAKRLPVAGDICAESSPAWLVPAHTVTALLPVALYLREEAVARYGYAEPPRVGAGGGLGDAGAIAAAFLAGADFVVTGSVNQCSPQARTSEAVKDLLAALGVDDTALAPAGELFELGGRTQVARGGTLFAARADALHQAYRAHRSLVELDGRTRRTFEAQCFGEPLDAVWERVRDGLDAGGRIRADHSDKHRMALVLRAYWSRATRLALTGAPGERLNYQVPCSAAMGAFNLTARGTDLESWRGRHVDVLARTLLDGAAERCARQIARFH